MTDTNDTPDVDNVMVPTEQPHPDHREHAKEPKHLDEDELQARTQHEREMIEAERTAEQPD